MQSIAICPSVTATFVKLKDRQVDTVCTCSVLEGSNQTPLGTGRNGSSGVFEEVFLSKEEEADVNDVDASLLLLTRSCCESGSATVESWVADREEADDTADVSECVCLTLEDDDVDAAALLFWAGTATAVVVGFSRTAAGLLLLCPPLDSFSKPDSRAFCCLTFKVT